MTRITLATAMVALASMTFFTTSAQALDRRVEIVNNSSYDMLQFYASNKGTNDWQEDIFGDKLLPAGNSVVIDIDDGTGYCKYDFLAVFDGGGEVRSNNNNVCELSRFTFND